MSIIITVITYIHICQLRQTIIFMQSKTQMYTSLFPRLFITTMHKHNKIMYDYHQQVILVHSHISYMKTLTGLCTSRKSHSSLYIHIQSWIIYHGLLNTGKHIHKHISPTSMCPHIIHTIQHVEKSYIYLHNYKRIIPTS